MGLDMYLNKRFYVKNWSHTPETEKHEIVIKRGGNVRTDIEANKIKGIICEVMTWRKSNQIHRWFVENIQGGEDDCKEYYVDKSQLIELLEIINKILLDHTLAEELLPTQSGFFFGGIEYDQYYFQDLEETKTILENEFSIPENDADYYYQSSW